MQRLTSRSSHLNVPMATENTESNQPNNQSAIAGSYCVRAFQMLYARAFKESSAYQMPELRVSFSCTIDNSFALLNLHWLDLSQGQTYCMAPLCPFDLSKDVHFSNFLVWTQAIGDWALSDVLPTLKEALGRLSRCASPVTPAPFFPLRRPSTMQSTKLRLDTGPALNKDELLISSLKIAFEDIPWRLRTNKIQISHPPPHLGALLWSQI